jgi:type II secretory pathway component GspD/PulD (secretin)
LQELDTIEQIVWALNVAPPQINIKATFLDLPEEELGEFARGIDMADALSTNTVALLGPAQVQKAHQILKDKEKATLMNQVSVTTLSGRQTQIAVQEMQTIVKNINPVALQSPGVAENAQGTTGLYLTETTPLGPTLDLIAYVAADGYTIQLTAIVALTEFLGYQTSTNTAEVYVDGKRQTAKIPLPMSRRRSMTHSAIIRDGETVLLGRAPTRDTLAAPERKTHLFVLLTPTIIDPAGNRVHPDSNQVPAPRR